MPFFVLIARASQRGMRPRRARWALGVRMAVLDLLALAAADPRVRAAADRLAVGFLVDVSDSVPPAAREDALTFVREALEAGAGRRRGGRDRLRRRGAGRAPGRAVAQLPRSPPVPTAA